MTDRLHSSSIAWIRSHSGRFACRYWPATQPAQSCVILLHGSMAHLHWWDHIAPQLNHQHDVITISMFGHGLSDHLESYPLACFFEQIEAVKRIFNPHHAPVVLVGHSLGGNIVAQYAQQHPQGFAHVLVVDCPLQFRFDFIQQGPRPPHRPGQDPQAMLQRFRTVPAQPISNRAIIQHIVDHSIIATPAGWVWQFDPNFFYKLYQANQRTHAHMESLPFPITNIYGTQSPVCSASALATMQKMHPHVQLIPIEGGYHALMLDQPKALIEKILQHLTPKP